jgi:hypothetical protein
MPLKDNTLDPKIYVKKEEGINLSASKSLAIYLTYNCVLQLVVIRIFKHATIFIDEIQ